jgi:uracil-DNA glycosylase
MSALINMEPVEAAALLRFYVDSGVTEGLSDEAVNRYELAPVAQAAGSAESVTARAADAPRRVPADRPSFSTNAPTGSSPASSPAAIPLDALPQDALALAETARAIAQSCSSLEELRDALSKFDACPLKSTAKNLVFADGNPEADIMLVGEAPGRDEDIQGLPFVGQAGHLLDRMLASIELDRAKSYLTNVLPWRPPGNRAPTPSELAMCAPFVERHIELAAPKLLLLVGAVSAKQMLGSNSGIMKLRGKWETVKVGNQEIPALPIFHPGYLLRVPAQKRLAWRDLLSFREKMSGL